MSPKSVSQCASVFNHYSTTFLQLQQGHYLSCSRKTQSLLAHRNAHARVRERAEKASGKVTSQSFSTRSNCTRASLPTKRGVASRVVITQREFSCPRWKQTSPGRDKEMRYTCWSRASLPASTKLLQQNTAGGTLREHAALFSFCVSLSFPFPTCCFVNSLLSLLLDLVTIASCYFFLSRCVGRS